MVFIKNLRKRELKVSRQALRLTAHLLGNLRKRELKDCNDIRHSQRISHLQNLRKRELKDPLQLLNRLLPQSESQEERIESQHVGSAADDVLVRNLRKRELKVNDSVNVIKAQLSHESQEERIESDLPLPVQVLPHQGESQEERIERGLRTGGLVGGGIAIESQEERIESYLSLLGPSLISIQNLRKRELKVEVPLQGAEGLELANLRKRELKV